MGLQWLIHRHVVASCEPRTAWKLMKKLPESCARKAARFASAALSSRLARKPYLMARTAIRTCAIWALVDGAVTFAVDVARHLHALLFGSPTVPAAVDDDGVHPPPRAVMPGHWQFLASRGISAALRVTGGSPRRLAGHAARGRRGRRLCIRNRCRHRSQCLRTPRDLSCTSCPILASPCCRLATCAGSVCHLQRILT